MIDDIFDFGPVFEQLGSASEHDADAVDVGIPKFDAAPGERCYQTLHRLRLRRARLEFEPGDTPFRNTGSIGEIVLRPAEHGPRTSDLRSLHF